MSENRPASTVLLLRDGARKPSLEVFMVKRHREIDFAGDALEMAAAGQATIIFPTRMNLKKLGQADTLAGVFMQARNADIIPIEPRIEERSGSQVLIIPSNAGYPVTEELLSSVTSGVASSSVQE